MAKPRIALATVFLLCAILSSTAPIWASSVSAQTIATPLSTNDTFGLKPIENTTSLAATDIRVIAGKVVRVFLSLLGVIAVGLIVYAGYLIMTSGGNEDKIGEGRKILVNAVIGLAIILSAFAIVQFILNKLSEATGTGAPPNGSRAPAFDSFIASGSLGRIVKDHYPGRDDKRIPRNARIAVTFREPIDPASIIADTDNDGVYGNCAAVAYDGTNGWWQNNCDRMRTSSVRIYRNDMPSMPIEAAVLSKPEGSATGTYSTFVFRPLDLLGSETTTVDYTVDLTGNIKKADGRTSAFVNERGGHYTWNFQTDTKSDTTPPTIQNIYPEIGTTIPKNSIIQITFDKAMDPTSIQGVTGEFTNILFGSSANQIVPTGEWRISNGYRTTEFISDTPCGQNSCGDLMYCIQLDCSRTSADESCKNTYSVLVRTAELFTNPTTPQGTSFEAVPFTGVMDMAGNALNTGPESTRRAPDGVIPGSGVVAVPHAPARAGDRRVLRTGEFAPDNFWWNFTVLNQIDRTPPYITQVTPGLDEESVAGSAPLTIRFSRVIWDSTVADIGLEEHPANTNGIDPIWFVPRVDIVGAGGNSSVSVVSLRHREFGPNQTALYYLPSIPSTVRAVNQNCMYPGLGPFATVKNTSPVCSFETDSNGATILNRNCVPFPEPVSSSAATGCVQTTLQTEGGRSLVTQPNIASCLSTMKRSDISSVSSSVPR